MSLAANSACSALALSSSRVFFALILVILPIYAYLMELMRDSEMALAFGFASSGTTSVSSSVSSGILLKVDDMDYNYTEFLRLDAPVFLVGIVFF